MKKKLLLAPLMAVLVACVVVLSGCGGPSIEELITEDLTTQFDEVKNGGDDFLSGLEEASGDEFEQLGIDPKEYAKTYLEGFDYEIGDVTVDEDKGVATAAVSPPTPRTAHGRCATAHRHSYPADNRPGASAGSQTANPPPEGAGRDKAAGWPGHTYRTPPASDDS